MQTQTLQGSTTTTSRTAPVNWYIWVSDGSDGFTRKMHIDDTDTTEAFSTVGITFNQLKAATTFVNLLDSGTLNVNITSAEQSDLEAFQVSPGALKLVGYQVNAQIETPSTLVNGDIVVTTTPVTLSAEAQAGLEAISFDGNFNEEIAVDVDLSSAVMSMLPDQTDKDVFFNDATYNEGIQFSDVMADTSIDMTGILVVDIDGSYIA